MAFVGFGVGRVAKDQEVKNVNGNSVINFELAVEDNYVGKDGKRGVTYVPFAAWGKTADAVAKYVKQGNLISYSVEDVKVNTYEKDDITYTSYINTLSQFEVLQVAQRNRAQAGKTEEPKSDVQASSADSSASVNPDDLPF